MIYEIKKFIKKEKNIFYILILSLVFSCCYIFSSNMPELFPYGKEIMDFFFTLFVSIIAAIIFYVLQVYIPGQKRAKNIRQKIDFQLYEIYKKMFSLFDLIMRDAEHSPSSFQEQIKSANLSKRDIVLGLQNKCMNGSYLYDDAIKSKLQPIGKKISKSLMNIDKLIERIFNFYQYLDSDEITLLEDIRNNFSNYGLVDDWNRSAEIRVGSFVGYTINPSLSYLAKSVYEYYLLFIKLQHNVLFINTLVIREVNMHKIQCLFYSGKFDEVKDTLNSVLLEDKNNLHFFKYYLFCAEHSLGNELNSLEILEEILDNKIDGELISSRSFLKEYLVYEEVVKKLKNYFSEQELLDLSSLIEKEAQQKKDFITTALWLEKYYKDKT